MSIALKHIKEQRFLKKRSQTKSSNIDDLEIPVTDLQSFAEMPIAEESAAPILKAECRVKNLDESILNYWTEIFGESASIPEFDLIKILLEKKCLPINPANNTLQLVEIHRAEYAGYIRQTSPFSHVWTVKKKH